MIYLLISCIVSASLPSPLWWWCMASDTRCYLNTLYNVCSGWPLTCSPVDGPSPADLCLQWELCPEPPVFVRCGKTPTCSAVTHGFLRTRSDLECVQDTFNLVERELIVLAGTAVLVLFHWLLTRWSGVCYLCTRFNQAGVGLENSLPLWSESAQNKPLLLFSCDLKAGFWMLS